MFTRILGLTLAASLASAVQLDATLAASTHLEAHYEKGYYCSVWNLEWETDKDTCDGIGSLQSM